MQVYSKSLLWSVKVNILCWFKCWHKSAQTFLLLFVKDFQLMYCDEFWYYIFVKEIVSCIKEKSKHQNNKRTILNVFVNVKMHIEKIIYLVFMLITNLAQVTLIFLLTWFWCVRNFDYVNNWENLTLLSLILIYSFMYI